MGEALRMGDVVFALFNGRNLAAVAEAAGVSIAFARESVSRCSDELNALVTLADSGAVALSGSQRERLGLLQAAAVGLGPLLGLERGRSDPLLLPPGAKLLLDGRAFFPGRWPPSAPGSRG